MKNKETDKAMEVIDILTKELIDLPECPNDSKIALMVLQQHRKTYIALRDILKYADPDTKCSVEQRKKALEYLMAVETGIRQFLEVIENEE